MPLIPLHLLRNRQQPAARRWALALLVCTGFAFAGAPGARGAEIRVGDAGSVTDAAKLDPQYPDMKEWATAGVRGGIPARQAGKVVKTLKPGDDIQAALDAAGKGDGGVVLLSAGTYPVSRRIDMRSNVILRGEDREMVVLENTMRSSKPGDAWYTVRFDGTKKAGLEDLTIRHAEVAKLGLGVYSERVAGAKNDVKGIGYLSVGGVQLERAQDCWIDDCNILHSGTDPLTAQGSHITVRDTLIDGAFNKGEEDGPGGSGNVSFSVDHGLMYDVTVRNVRHALLMHGALGGGACKYNAIVDCNFEGDVNFHGNRKDDGHNLFEGDLVHAPPSHGWCAWSYWRRQDIGEGNLVYKSIGWGGPGKDLFSTTSPDQVYSYAGVRDPNVLGKLGQDKKPPTGGTLFAVTGLRSGKIDEGAWPKTPAEAYKVLRARMPKNVLTRPATQPAKRGK